MPTYVVHGCKSASQKCAALVTAADTDDALAAAEALGLRTAGYAQVQIAAPTDLAVPDVAFYGDAIGAPGNGTWPDHDRAS